MRLKTCIGAAITVALLSGCLVGCSPKSSEADFSGYKEIAEPSTQKCTYHNVAVIQNEGANLLFGLNLDYKKAWFEYDGTVELGIDVSQVSISSPDESNKVVVTIPKVKVLDRPSVDISCFSDIYSEKGLAAQITTADQNEALNKAQEEMLNKASNDTALLEKAETQVKSILEQYIKSVGETQGVDYTVEFKEA